MLSGIHTTKPRTQRYIDAFVRGAGQGKIYHFRELKQLPKEQLTMYGILAGSGEIYKQCEKENKDFYFMDHGYFTNAHVTPHWLRITKNKHCQNILQQRPSDRYEKNFKQDMKPWKKGKKVLVLPPTNAIGNFFNTTDWLDKTIKTLKENTDREIDIREKPYNPIVAKDHVGATVKIETKTVHKSEINWNDYHAMVTYNSNTMVASLTNGVPVFCDPVNSAAAPISETDFSKIETPIYGDRVALFSSLAYNNWTLKEMADGTAWRMLNEG
tara:strand:- start:727 stop:1536 length:810 start_codon:yes stop_codon:yes gene_type:complete